jgi:sugar phosphate isomerase/epimerase
MKKVSIGSWAFVFQGETVLLPELCQKLEDLKFDGISMGGFAPHADPKLFDTKEKKDGLKKLLKDHNLEVAEYAADLWSVDSLKDSAAWLDLFDKAVEFMDYMGFKKIRIDSGTVPILPDGMTYENCQDKIKENFHHCAKKAAQYGIDIAWEFEPGFMINEPKNIVKTVDELGEKNFSILFDTCHGYMSSVIGARHIEEGCTLKGGLKEFIQMCKGRIGHVHVIDSDGSLNVANTSTHNPFGTGNIDFDEAIPALLNDAGYKGDWWAIDLCEWPDPLKAISDCKDYVDAFNAKYCK